MVDKAILIARFIVVATMPVAVTSQNEEYILFYEVDLTLSEGFAFGRLRQGDDPFPDERRRFSKRT